VENRLKNSLLAAYYRLHEAIKIEGEEDVRETIKRMFLSDDLPMKTRFLVELDQSEQRRPLTDRQREDRRRFRLSQAFWGSSYDWARARQPLVDDWQIAFPENW
jgi:hypothetical protein